MLQRLRDLPGFLEGPGLVQLDVCFKCFGSGLMQNSI